jgi:hypothetical protein
MVPTLSQMHLVHTFPPCFPTIHSDIILPSKPTSSERSLPFRFSDQSFVHISQFSHARYMPHLPHYTIYCINARRHALQDVPYAMRSGLSLDYRTTGTPFIIHAFRQKLKPIRHRPPLTHQRPVGESNLLSNRSISVHAHL